MKNMDLTDTENNFSNNLFSHLSRVDHLFFSSKIDNVDQINFFKLNKIKTVIDLKTPGELAFDDKAAFEKAGMKYINFPFQDISEIDFEKLNQFSRMLNQPNENILVYCMSSNRVGSIMAMYLSKICGHPKKRSMEIGQFAGMKRPDLIKKVELILEQEDL